MLDLRDYGFGEDFAAALEALARPELVAGRVSREYRKSYEAITHDGEVACEIPGRVRREMGPLDIPAVGDWLALAPGGADAPALVEAVLTRRGSLVRHAAGLDTVPQVLAANVDTLFIVTGLDRDFNPRRLERYLTVAWPSGAQPVIVLNKADLCDDIDECVVEANRVGLGVPVHVVSAKKDQGIELLREHLGPGKTAAFVGSSGAGKSSLANRLLGEERLRTGEVRAHDQRGRHVTTRRELVLVPGAGCIIDTPGLRELQLWGDEEGLARAFADVEEVARGCRFSDCKHDSEPGCAVREAVEGGTLDEERYASYVTLQRELASLQARSREYEVRAEGRRFGRLVREFERLSPKRRG